MRQKTYLILTLPMALILAALASFAAPAQASTGTINASHTAAVVGQYLTISGNVGSKGVKAFEIERTLYSTVAARGKTKPNGSYAVRFRMTAMPTEGYRLRMKGRAKSKTVYVNSIRQNVSIAGSDGTAQVTVYPAMVRQVELQQQTSPSAWTTVASQSTDANGQAMFSTPEGPVYRALARQRGDIVEYYSTPLITVSPNLSSTPSSLGGPTNVYPVQVDSNNSAAAKFNWWPVAKVWDWEDTRGMNKWTNWTTGSGRASLTYGGLILNSGTPGNMANFGSVSSTLTKRGAAEGNWEFKSRHAQQGSGYTPYTVRYSLVPQNTPDGVRPSTEIVVAQHVGYTDQTTVSVRDGQNEYVKTFTGWSHNAANWHAYGLQITKKKITWVINGKTVAAWRRTGNFNGVFVPRMELVGVENARMTATSLNTDWIRYFKLKPRAQLRASTAGFTQTPLAVLRPNLR